ncbi:hypothetical protein Y032_0755g2080 [Ancylostoma ceylanicum]|uniref:Uncharacterized protein n=1 Tax=Ancylostoma ceylanicum TaxID=53326 RepID=A0A016WDP4_9BILA|nr:hypothetical protein Y032_0755g2080 [Ancylostoma ceylanicum]
MIITWSSHPVYLTLLSSARAARAPGTLRAAIGAVRISAIGCFCLLSKGYGMLHSDAVAATVLHQNFSRHCSYDNAQSKTNRGISDGVAVAHAMGLRVSPDLASLKWIKMNWR